MDEIRDVAKREGADAVMDLSTGADNNAMRRDPWLMNVVSRGGAFTIAWMIHNEADNPLFAEFDYLLEIARKYNLTLSLGDGMRPG
jgi:phosphomethylpyrimidine synthase